MSPMRRDCSLRRRDLTDAGRKMRTLASPRRTRPVAFCDERAQLIWSRQLQPCRFYAGLLMVRSSYPSSAGHPVMCLTWLSSPS